MEEEQIPTKNPSKNSNKPLQTIKPKPEQLQPKNENASKPNNQKTVNQPKGIGNFNHLKQVEAPKAYRHDSDESDKVLDNKSLKRNQANNVDYNYGNLIDDSIEVRLNTRKADPSFD